MSSDQRYQSQLFNIILRQSRELTDQWQRNARQARVAAFWSLQMAIYPVYLLFQVTRLSEQVLRQADTQGQRLLKAALDPEQSPLQGAHADIPICRVLEAIQISAASAEADAFVVDIATSSAQRLNLLQRYQRWFKRLSQRRSQTAKGQANAMFRGLATDLEGRYLILVTPDNEPLDVLAPAQQKQLLQLMIWEVAHHQRQQRLNQQLREVTKLSQRPLKLPVTRSQMLPPVRGFRKMMGWFQTSPMATTTNLFQEAEAVDPLVLLMGHPDETIPLPEALGATLKRLSPQVTPEVWAMMDVAIASLETQSQQLMKPATGQLSEPILQLFKQRHHSPHLRPSPRPAFEELVPSMQAMNWLQSAGAALFGGSPVPIPPTASMGPVSAGSQQVSERQTVETWPSGDERYGAKTQQASSPIFAQQSGSQVAQARPGTNGLVMTEPDLAGRVTLDEQGIEIEVDAVFVEYEQHPLERILNVLDSMVVWLEKRLIPWFEQSWSVVKVYFQKLGQP
jgi:hypothetical protein